MGAFCSSLDAGDANQLPASRKNAEQTKNEDYDSDVDGEFVFRERKAKSIVPSADGGFEVEEKQDGESFSAVKPWIGQVFPPSQPPANDSSAPEKSLELEWIYGYNCQNTSNNMTVNSQGHLVYPAAAVVVVYDPVKHSQRYYCSHTDTVSCLAAHPTDIDVVATGQVAFIGPSGKSQDPFICVHNSKTGEEWVLPSLHKRVVNSVGFNADGSLLASVGQDDNHSIIIWDWKGKKKVIDTKGDTNKIMQLSWHPTDPTTFATVGEKHAFVWTWDGQAIKSNRVIFGDQFPVGTFPCVSWSKKGLLLIGTKDGNIYCAEDKKVKYAFPRVQGTTLSVVPLESGIIAGGKDGKVVVCDAKMNESKVVDVQGGSIKAICVHGSDAWVGTGKGSIHHIKDFATNPVASLRLSGHNEGELWSLATHPSDGSIVVTAGEDNKVMLWNTRDHKLLRQFAISSKEGKKQIRKGNGASTTSTLPDFQCARVAAFSPDGAYLACGLNSGEVAVFETASGTQKALVDLNSFGKRAINDQKGNWIQAMKYSPNGKVLAVGTHGIITCLLDVTKAYKCMGKLDKSSAAPTHMDWSADSKYLQTNDLSYELLFYEINHADLSASKQITASKSLVDVKWASQTCILAWPVQGIFDPSMDGTDVNCVDVSPDGTLIATGDDFSKVNLYRYPCLKGNAKKSSAGHASFVVTVRFAQPIAGKTYLYAVGGGDQCLSQWLVQ